MTSPLADCLVPDWLNTTVFFDGAINQKTTCMKMRHCGLVHFCSVLRYNIIDFKIFKRSAFCINLLLVGEVAFSPENRVFAMNEVAYEKRTKTAVPVVTGI